MDLLELMRNEAGVAFYKDEVISEFELTKLGSLKKLAVRRDNINGFLNGLDENNRFVPQTANAYVVLGIEGNPSANNIQFYHLSGDRHFHLTHTPF